MPSCRTLVTGFGPFGAIADNPSAWLAERCGRPFRILEVSFAAVDRFVRSLGSDGFDRLVMLGVAGGEQDPRLRLEVRAQNRVGAVPDVTGVFGGPGPIEPGAPPQLAATLFTGDLASDAESWRVSVDAGHYLCNYAMYRALLAFPDAQVGFVHVPPADIWRLEDQLVVLEEVLRVIEQEPIRPATAYWVESPEAMRRLGSRLVQRWRPGEVVALEGPLGAGKTTLVRGVLEALGWTEPVRSPTFNLIQEFPTVPPVCHADLYRVASEDGLDLERYLDTHLCLVEWPDRLREIVPDRTVRIEPDGDGRLVDVRPVPSAWRGRPKTILE